MPNPTWPASLPIPSDEGASYAPMMENVITSQVETGAPKRRRRFTAMPQTFTCSLVLTGPQCATLDAFVTTTLQDVLPFDWKDFRSGAAATYVFNKRPTYTFVAPGAGLWRATIELMKKP